ncbi:MAG: BA14K family protein [Nitratireductor sp.]|nr:BA14K family protein [Nitratireductor sp.]
MLKLLHLAAVTAVLATTLTVHAPSAFAGGGFAPPGIQPCFNPGGCNPPGPGGGLVPPPPGGGGGGGGGNGGLGGFGAGLVGGMIGGVLINGLNQPQTVVVQQPPVMVQPVPQPVMQPMPQPVMAGGDAHIQYCMTKYKSYKIPTNTYTSYSGQIKPCISPYM